MALTSRSKSRAPSHSSPDPAVEELEGSVAETASEHSSQAHIHILPGGYLLIDLTSHDPAPSTDMRCPNCAGSLRVEHVGSDLRSAELRCLDCQFVFAQRLVRQADERRIDASTDGRGRFRHR